MAYDSERRFQIFVSSTFTDLQEERQKVLQAILEMRAFPSGMELFPAATEEQWAFIKSEIDSSDLYVVIVAGRYGSLAANGISFTEQEHDYAVAQEKTVLRFLHRDIGALPSALVEHDDAARSKLLAFKNRLQQDKLLSFYDNADDLKAKVWHGLSRAMALKQSGGWVRAQYSSAIEDLRKISSLQEQLFEARQELDKLKAGNSDPRRHLKHLDDFITWKPAGQHVPEEVTLRPSLRDLFLAAFPNADPAQTGFDISRRLGSLVIRMVVESHGGSKILLDQNSISNVGELLNILQLQFLALGLITVQITGATGSLWVLTSDGVIELGLMRGLMRNNLDG